MTRRVFDNGLFVEDEYFSIEEQSVLVRSLIPILQAAPPYFSVSPNSKKAFELEMTNAGYLGWISDTLGHRYQTVHPKTLDHWPEIPNQLLKVWDEFVDDGITPECCLIGLYGPHSKVGLHQDSDEYAKTVPIVSVSIGYSAFLEIGDIDRHSLRDEIRLDSGSVCVFSGKSRNAFHCVEKMQVCSELEKSVLRPLQGYSSYSELVRLNLTLRKVLPTDFRH